jgi:drug/metabolite transporter (DMT)-like permease
MNNKTLIAHLAMIIVQLIYGVNYNITKIAMPEYIQPFALVFLRVSVALVLFWLVASTVIKEKVERKDIAVFALFGLFGVAGNQLFFLKGLSLTSPINAAIIMISNPIIVYIFSLLYYKEKFSIINFSGIVLGISGALILLLFNNNFSFGSDTLLGDTMILINSTSWAVFVVGIRKYLQKYNTFSIIKWVFLFGLFYVTPFSFSELRATNFSTWTPQIWMAIGFVVVFTTFIAYILNTYCLRHLSAATVSAYIYLQPFIAGVFAILYFNEELTWKKVIAALLIFIGVYLVSQKQIVKTEQHD